MRDELILETPEQLHALAHPLRQRILNILADDVPLTNKKLADALSVSPPRLHFHMKELQAAGLIEIVAEQPKGNVIEKYYQPTARVFRLSSTLTENVQDMSLMETTLVAIRQQYTQAHTHFHGQFPHFNFASEPLRLSDERLQRIQEHLNAVKEEMYLAIHDPQRESYDSFVALSFLLHSFPSFQEDTSSPTGEEE